MQAVSHWELCCRAQHLEKLDQAQMMAIRDSWFEQSKGGTPPGNKCKPGLLVGTAALKWVSLQSVVSGHSKTRRHLAPTVPMPSIKPSRKQQLKTESLD